MLLCDLLKSIKNDDNALIIEAIAEAHAVLNPEACTKVVSVKFRNYDTALADILDLYKGTQNGIIILDPEDYESTEPTASFVKAIPKKPSTSRIVEYDVDISEKDEDEYQICTITITGNDDKNVEVRANMFSDLLHKIGQLGNSGHYFELHFHPTSRSAKSKQFGWDGDGSDYIDIDSITIK